MDKWLGLVLSLLAFTNALNLWMAKRRLISEAEAQVAQKALEEAQNDIRRAKEVRARVRHELTVDNGSGTNKLREDDGFRRDSEGS